MKLTKPNIKIKLSRDNLLNLLEYLNEILEHENDYLHFINCKEYLNLLDHNIREITEQVIKLIFNNSHKTNYKGNLILNHAQRISLYVITASYPVPLNINFIEYEVKNKLTLK